MPAKKRRTPLSVPHKSSSQPAKKRRTPLSVRHKSWTTRQLATYLRLFGIDDGIVSQFIANNVKGENLSKIKDDDVKKWNVSSDQRDEVMKIIRHIRVEKVDEEGLPKVVFNDSVHGHIELDPLLVRIINTPQFQRLRDIKQLGAGYFVFPGASHNRFEHSIGVSHLAGCLVSRLRQEQPSLEINDVDVLCVKLAGLCHDLGHGPFSHVFDAEFIPMFGRKGKWRHEEASVDMLRHMIEVNELGDAFSERGISPKDVIFIEEMIDGPQHGQDSDVGWKYKGRDKDKGFLYEIVSNKLTGIDVDKWDYFARDCHHLGIANMFDYRRFMQFARVIEVEKTLRICTRDKEVGNLYDMFHTRDALHRRAYQHKTVKIIETMICEAFSKANDHFFLPGKDGKKVKMSEAIYDMAAYTHLSDRVFYTLLASTEKKLEKTRQILQAVQCRHLHPFVAEGTVPPKKPISEDDAPSLAEAIVAAISKTDLDQKDLPVLTKNDVFIHIVNFNYGKKDEDPIEHMYFYEKGNRDKAKTIDREKVSHMLPEQFREQKIRLYIRDRKNQEKRKRAKSCFQEWCSKTEMIMGDGLLGILTPKKPSTSGRTTPTTSGSTTSEPTTSERNTRRKVDFSTK
eukprot:scpid93024/ scgid7051/ SAM domain and HD domain-containing protein 1; Dendritic cell-derived IFNG-induced protein; Monocyte protein 5